MAEARFEQSITIQAPANKIYDYVADILRHNEWNKQPEVMHQITPGPIEVGTIFRAEEGYPRDLPIPKKVMFTIMKPFMKLFMGATGQTEAKVVALEPGKLVAWNARLPARKIDLMRMNWKIVLEPNGDVTKVTQQCHMCPPDDSPLANMINDDLVKTSKGEVSANLELLKNIMEK